ncbi:unnamed protein product, partial [Adineta steineri]
EKFQGYVFVDKNGNEYPCTVEYAPNQSYPKSEQQSRKDPKLNSIEQDPKYQTFLANINAPLSASEALPNAETILEETEKKQRDLQESKNKPGVTTTPLLEFLRRKREEKKQVGQAKMIHLNNRIYTKNIGKTDTSTRYGSGGDRSNRQQRGYDKSDYRTSNQEQKRPNDNNKPSKNRESQNPKSKQSSSSSSQQQSSKESKTILNTKSNNEDSLQNETQTKRDTESIDTTNDNIQNDERPNSSNKASSSAAQKNPNAPVKNRPSIQIYNPGERAKMRKQQPPSS